MLRLTEDELQQRDAERDLNAELLESIDDLEAGRLGRVSIVRGDQVVESPVIKARLAARLSQARFASLLGISKRTLQDWEQGRRQPSGAAKTLLLVAERHLPGRLRQHRPRTGAAAERRDNLAS
jgi:putative transcriptional regulator